MNHERNNITATIATAINRDKPIARQIVAMLMRRERDAARDRRSAVGTPRYYEAHAAELEAHNAAEYARRILYGLPL